MDRHRLRLTIKVTRHAPQLSLRGETLFRRGNPVCFSQLRCAASGSPQATPDDQSDASCTPIVIARRNFVSTRQSSVLWLLQFLASGSPQALCTFAMTVWFVIARRNFVSTRQSSVLWLLQFLASGSPQALCTFAMTKRALSVRDDDQNDVAPSVVQRLGYGA